jgi:hypothetical protein
VVALADEIGAQGGDDNYEGSSMYTFTDDAYIMNLMPHMHLRGKDFQYRLAYLDGTSKIILSVPRYSFAWETRYEFRELVPAPKGSRLDCVGHFYNSEENKWNPDPTKTIRRGQQTWDEMMIGLWDSSSITKSFSLVREPRESSNYERSLERTGLG